MKDTVFQSILKPITTKLIRECTERFQSDYHYETFNTLEHLQAMIYAHVNEIKSLRTLEVAINSQKIGIRTKIRRSTLSDANGKRPAECFFWLLEKVMSTLPSRRCKDIKKVIKILDSSPIQLRGPGYDWSKQHATRHIQGLKLHVEYDFTLSSPTKIITSYANINDASMGKRWPIIADTIYVFDRGYYDYNWWWSIHKKQAYFVTRLKKNAAIIVESKKRASDNANVLQDCIFRISKKVPRGGKRMEYSDTLRSISVKREGKAPLILVTNLKDLPAEKIAELYKSRWEIELFFKWIKQNLKIKKFLGRSENAVQIQIATAIIAYLLVQIFKAWSRGKLSLRLTLTWVKYNLSIKLSKKIVLRPPAYPPSSIKPAKGALL